MAFDLSVFPIIISSITASIFVITLIITWKSIKENTRATHSQLLRSFHEDLTNRLNKNTVGEDFRETTKRNWPNYIQYCEKTGIKQNSDDRLPKIMLDYNKVRENES